MVNTPVVFYPDRRPGQILNAGASALLIGAGILGLWQASQAQASPVFILYLFPALLAVVLAPVFLYRLQALNKASYAVERDGIRLKWGLRIEDIPMDQVLWMQMSSHYKGKLPLPWHAWPGAVLGKRLLPDQTPIEFLSAVRGQMVLIGATNQVYAISPAKPAEFLQAFTRLAELGSLASIPARTQRPSFLLKRLWDDSPARGLVLSGLALSLFLLVGVVLVIPSRTQIMLRPAPVDDLNSYVPSIRLLLLPVLNTTFFTANFLAGLFFFRKIDWPTTETNVMRALSYVLFGSGFTTAVLFTSAVLYILRNS